MKYFIANWKANKNLGEAQQWVTDFLKKIDDNPAVKQKIEKQEAAVIICPPFPLLSPLKDMLGHHTISVGCQDISLYEGGTYTGEVTAYILESLAQYAIIGHSERKKYFHETDDNVKTKYVLAKKYNIKPIYCVAAPEIPYPSDVQLLCYEPPEAISSGDGRGNYEPLEAVLLAKKKLHPSGDMKFIYGGSVNEDNVDVYLKSNEIDGFLVGGASLDPAHFFNIIKK